MKRQEVVNKIYRKLIDSDFTCALTGWKISEESFELDHIVSIQDGGTDLPDNLQCVHPIANKAKGTMGNDQFIAMCMAVADHARKSQATLQGVSP